MRYAVHVSRGALQQIHEHHAYIAADSPANADRFLERLVAAIDGLHDMPRRCPVAIEESEVLGVETRVLIVGELPDPVPDQRPDR